MTRITENMRENKYSSSKWLPRDLFPFESKFTEVDGNSVHYVDEGSGPTLLLLHGNPTWSFLYRDIIFELRSRFRCIALDYPGFGLSKAVEGYDFLPRSHAGIVKGFVEYHELEDITVVVQDWGGPIGLWVAARNPDRFRALVIGNTWAWPIDGDPHFERFSKLMGGRIGGFLIRRFNAFVNVMLPLGVKRRRLTRKIMVAYRAPMSSPHAREPTHIFPREILGSSAFLADVEEGLDKLAALPTLIIWGDRDIAFRVQERVRFERVFVNHKTLTLRGAGHYIQEDAAGEMSRAIVDWWDELPVISSESTDGG